MAIVEKIDTSPALGQIRAAMLQKQATSELKAPRTCPKAEWPPDLNAVWAWRAQQEALFQINPAALESAKTYYKHRPVEFINHWGNTYDPRNVGVPGKSVWMPMIMFPRQAEFVDFLQACYHAEAPGLVEKSRDMGASWVAINWSIWLWLFWPGVAIGWGSRKQEQVDRLGDMSSLFEKMRQSILRLPKAFAPRLGDNDLKQYVCRNPENGSSIIGEIGDDIGRGGRTRVYFVDEAGHLTHPEAVEASLSDNTRVRIDLSSVSGLGTVFHRTRESGVDWEPGNKVEKYRTNVFVMDWSDHPEKTEEWHTRRKEHYQGKGLPHVFAREVDRDYAASVEGVIIPAEFVRSAIDAHLKYRPGDEAWEEGEQTAGLDVADEGMDTNAILVRKGPMVKTIAEWGERDVGVSTRKAIAYCTGLGPITLCYDSIGIGAGVKAEANRLGDDKLLPPGIKLIPWNAGAAVLNPGQRVLQLDNGKDDPDSPKNKDYYANLKAQGWWMLRRRFERTHRAVIGEVTTYDPSELISLPSGLPLLRKFMKELSQPVAVTDTKMRLKVDKKPEGASSPNLGDAGMMAFWPWSGPGPGRAALSGIIVVR